LPPQTRFAGSLAAADVGIAMGARGATVSSEAAEVVILVDRVDRVAEAVKIGRRTYAIARQSIAAGMALSAGGDGGGGVWLAYPGGGGGRPGRDRRRCDSECFTGAFVGQTVGSERPGATARNALARSSALEQGLNHLREIADALDDAQGKRAVSLVTEANAIVQREVVKHEREDEATLYPRLSKKLADTSGLAAMSRAHREIQHLARLLLRLSTGLRAEDADRYLVRDAQRVIESIEALVRLHNAQEEDIYAYVLPV
jgi:hypothetical protein